MQISWQFIERNALKKQRKRKITHKNKCLGIWELVLDYLDDSHDTTTDLFRCVPVIVGADP